jgi:hypothetical protein
MAPSIRPKYQFESSQFYFQLLRLTDQEYQDLRTRSFPIQYDEMILWSLARSNDRESELLTLPKLLLLLEQDFGRSSALYAPWKQGFSFPFLLEIQKDIGPLYYLIRIADYRGHIEMKFYRVIDDAKYLEINPDVYHPPSVAELSQFEIAHMVSYIWGFYQGYAQSYFQDQSHITPFFRYIASENLVYGYWDNQFVEQQFQDDQDCRDLVADLEQKYGESSKSDQDKICITQEMIIKIVTS